MSNMQLITVNTDLPVFWDIESMANYLNVDPTIIVDVVANADNLYRTFYINKDTGAITKYSEELRLRRIDAPSDELKLVQNAIKDLVSLLPYSDANYGFVEGRGIKDAAAALSKGEVIVHCDIKDFFPSHTVTLLLKNLATLFNEHWGMLISKDFLSFIVKAITLHGKLPQGSPCSPMITTVLNKDLDDKLTALASEYGLKYARYADDLCFSGKCSNADCTDLIYKLQDTVHPLRLNASKTGIMRTSSKPICKGYTIRTKGFMQSTMQAKVIEIVKNTTNNIRNIRSNPHEIVVNIETMESLEEFTNLLKMIGNSLNSKYPSYNFVVRRYFYYIQSVKTVLGLHVDDGKVNYPTSKYKDLRLEAMLIGKQRALFYIKKLSNSVHSQVLRLILECHAANSIGYKTRKNMFRNMLMYPINRRTFNGKRAYIKNVDPNKYNKLVDVENKHFKKTLSIILEELRKSNDLDTYTSIRNLVSRYI